MCNKSRILLGDSSPIAIQNNWFRDIIEREEGGRGKVRIDKWVYNGRDEQRRDKNDAQLSKPNLDRDSLPIYTYPFLSIFLSAYSPAYFSISFLFLFTHTHTHLSPPPTSSPSPSPLPPSLPISYPLSPSISPSLSFHLPVHVDPQHWRTDRTLRCPWVVLCHNSTLRHVSTKQQQKDVLNSKHPKKMKHS